ncbi:MAG: radical SAM protein [Chloroflexi bacterium]|nr:radical SAM protein [Chloroflexota bacterium]
MPRRTQFTLYKPKSILNKHKRADHWFWSRYTAYPYLGCQHGCEFCYCREQKFSPYDNPDDFAYTIKVKENAPQLLRKALTRAKTDVIFTGDYQPAEKKFQLSRKMLKICLERNFPVFILERSPLILRDLDLLTEIESRARAVVSFSIISTPDSPHYQRIRQMERLAPPPEKRFAAMEKFASAGLMTGTSMMPLLPELCDDDANLESIIKWTADHGGSFVLASGLTLSDQQRSYFFQILAQRFPDLLPAYKKHYPAGKSYGAVDNNWRRTALKIRELCQKHGIKDRMPRPIIPGDKFATNKRIVEILADKLYAMELENVHKSQLWAYRKAAWAVEDLQQDIKLIYRTMGLKGIQSVENISPSLGKVIEKLLANLLNEQESNPTALNTPSGVLKFK